MDNCPAVANPDQADADADSAGDACDNCLPIANPDQANSDADPLGNACDNCPAAANPSQADCDGDGLGDACETDPDANLNGVLDTCETGPLVFSVPQHFANVGSAIAVATPGSVVQVGPGTYSERIDFAGKAFTLESTAGAANTILDGGGLPDSVVSFRSGEGPGSVLRGFTVRNGRGGTLLPQAPWQFNAGGGLSIHQSSPTVEDCIIEKCSAPWGGGIFVFRSSPVIRRCIVRDNVATGGGGGLLLLRGYGAVVEECLLEGNEASEGGAILCELGWATVRDSDLIGNLAVGEGSAVLHRHLSPDPGEPPFLAVENCLIRQNESLQTGAAVRAYPADPPTMSVAGTEICDNGGLNLEGPFIDAGGNEICSCPADVDLSGAVNAIDIAVILGNWGSDGGKYPRADIDGSGTVEGADLAAVLAGWGDCP